VERLFDFSGSREAALRGKGREKQAAKEQRDGKITHVFFQFI
jgi:hypothetical protein